ncbi:Nitrogen permease regulator 2-like protein [Phlyctema vagabunda]|uniref:Nitrogen permease regulator 2-like protein n=1 Tax=Phlyctema vagabunda TaxID=108571 RepID=A0ABR4PLM4_9HELO
MAPKRPIEDDAESHPRPKRPRSKFDVGPENLPDGTWRRKVIKIKQDLIHKSKVKKSYAKIKAREPIVERPVYAQDNDDDDDREGEKADSGPEPTQELHPDRQAMLNGPREPTPPPLPDQSQVFQKRISQTRKGKRPAYFEKEQAIAEQKKQEAEARRLDFERRDKEKKEKIEERERFRRAMAKARTGGKNGQRKLDDVEDTMIEGIFFSRFLPKEGTRVVYQNPPGCVALEEGVDKHRLFDFETVAEYVIPRQAFCNRIVTICDPEHKYHIIGHPVCIQDQKYERNEFMFNFCIVIKVDVRPTPYRAAVSRLAGTFTEMEIQNQFLSQIDDSNTQDRRAIGPLLEIVREDLNNYNECNVPIDAANTINMKLFKIHATPPYIKGWHVPISQIKFSEIVDDTWDLSMQKVIKEIDGIKEVRRIARDADVAPNLTKIALRHLAYYETIIILDMFLFGNIYQATAEIKDFIDDRDDMQSECANYVMINGPRIPNFYLCRLFTTLITGRTLKEWIKFHLDEGLEIMQHVDVRRFVHYGLVKGLIYRVYKYAVSHQYLASKSRSSNTISLTSEQPHDLWTNTLYKYADGCHTFDQISTEKNLADAKVMEHLRKWPKGDLEILYR